MTWYWIAIGGLVLIAIYAAIGAYRGWEKEGIELAENPDPEPGIPIPVMLPWLLFLASVVSIAGALRLFQLILVRTYI